MTQQEELSAAMRRIFDALAFMRGPDGDVIYVGEKALHMAWHLARAGADVHPEKAVIKRQPVPPVPGGLAGLVEWVPVGAPDVPDTLSAVGEVPDPATLVDALPWHVKTHIEGAFK
jgi:hypothetical protein